MVFVGPLPPLIPFLLPPIKGHTMFRKLALTAFMLFILSACTSQPEHDLTGSWKTVENGSSITMTALVSGGELEIVWINSDIQGLYWKGSAPDVVKPGDIFVSEGDVELMSRSLLASMDETKEFRYASDEISFDLTVLGITQTIRLERVW